MALLSWLFASEERRQLQQANGRDEPGARKRWEY